MRSNLSHIYVQPLIKSDWEHSEKLCSISESSDLSSGTAQARQDKPRATPIRSWCGALWGMHVIFMPPKYGNNPNCRFIQPFMARWRHDFEKKSYQVGLEFCASDLAFAIESASCFSRNIFGQVPRTRHLLEAKRREFLPPRLGGRAVGAPVLGRGHSSTASADVRLPWW